MSLFSRSRNLTQAVRYAGTCVQPSPGFEVDTRENELVNPNFANRNPRNLERLALALKDRGWATVWPNREYWHR
ncbi:hypothetical protein FKM82_018413 [Ascaphus truei]